MRREGAADYAEAIRVEQRTGVVRIVWDRAAAGNAVDLDLARETLSALRWAEADPTVHVLTLTGSGRFFSAGGDVKGMAGRPAAERPGFLRELASAARDLALAMVRSRLLIIAGVNGTAAGAGLGLILNSDWALIREDATVLAAYAAIGLSPDTGVSYLLPRAVGHQRSVELTLGDRRLTGAEAVEWGIAAESVAAEEFAERLTAVEDRFLAGAVGSYGPTKRLLRRGVIAEYETHLAEEISVIAGRSGTPESAALVEGFAGRG
ncbi:enoyl-CoA hydratase/isomerase family protein [Kocuria marina]|uniref:enoyl-CoA hydratase/isomerase family protein n=1 Tax=Kocuria marina TaxID=223184 RepID=UPI0022E01106|nr:enoyl-CoA hydratase/isomerase family protein [Kocuria marina]